MKRIIKGLLPLAAAVLPLAAQADFMAMSSTLPSGNQLLPAGLAPLTLRQDFFVNSDITVTGLGAFDSGSNGFTNWVAVGIYRNDGTLLGARGFNGSTDALAAGSSYRYYTLAPNEELDLAPGAYSVVAWGYGGENNPTLERNGNTAWGGTLNKDTGGGLISFSSGGYYGLNAASLNFPTSADANQYMAGSFTFVANGSIAPAAVPLPGTLALAALGLGLLGARRRKV